jgi:diphosphomevalonate decarboxylase
MKIRPRSATAAASPNIALIKYWGNRDEALRLPSNGSISMTLGGLETVTEVTFDPNLRSDRAILNARPAAAEALRRISEHLARIRALAGLEAAARVRSRSNFPTGVGIASSASAFAALTVATAAAAGLHLDSTSLSRLARRGSGSACRSIFGGFVEWRAGEADDDSLAAPLAPGSHWPLVDLIAIVSLRQKAVGSTEGHALAATSAAQAARVADAPRRLGECRQALLKRDFARLAAIVEHDSNWMHAVMLTSRPTLLYWMPETLRLMTAIVAWRGAGLEICYTIDAGPNVHCLCAPQASRLAARRLRRVPGVLEVIACPPGDGARLLPSWPGRAKRR